MTTKPTISQKLAKAAMKAFPNDYKIVKIRLLYSKEVSEYLSILAKAREKTKNSNLIFKTYV